MSEVITLKELKNGIALSDVAMVVLKTTDKGYAMRTATEASMKARVDAGKETPLRKGNTLYAQNVTDDLVMGYDLEMTHCQTHPEAVALIEGGVVVNSEQGAFQKYTAPAAGTEVVRTPFTLEVYCIDKDTDGAAKGYMKFTYPNCRGKSAVEWDVKDGDFFTPKLVIRSAPSMGESPMTADYVDTLPAVSA